MRRVAGSTTSLADVRAGRTRVRRGLFTATLAMADALRSAISMALFSLREVARSIAALRATASKCVPKYAGQFPSAAGTDETAAWWHLTPTEHPRPRLPSRCFIDASSMLCRPLPSKLLITHARAAPAPRLADKSTRRQSGGACALLLTAPACCHGDELIWACERRPISTLRRTEL